MSGKPPVYKMFYNRDQPPERRCGQQVAVAPPRARVELDELS